MQYYIIGDEDSVLGFRMVGVRGQAVHTKAEAENAFRAVIEDESKVAIIIITERVADLIRPLVDRYIFREKFPLIIEIPDGLGPVSGKPDLRTLVNEAIGIKL